MFDPVKELQDSIIKFESKLNFTFTWMNNHLNYDNFIKQYDKYKKKLGWYVNLYVKSEDIINNFHEIYKPYTKILKIPNLDLKKNIELSIESKLLPNGNNFILEKNNKLYKGVKYFYTPEQEKFFYKELKIAYYSDIFFAYKYAKKYSGGLQVYKLKRNIKLFNITNDENIIKILELLKNKFKDGKKDNIFFDEITYKEFYKAIKTKYGVQINKYYQIYNFSKYSNYNDLWLYLPKDEYISDYTNIYDKSYTGWSVNGGKIDRICANGLYLLLKNKYDGLIHKIGYYTPLKKNTYSNGNLVLWNQDSFLKRLPEDEFDSMQFIKHLHFNPLDINFDINLYNRNKNFKVINYYLDNKIDKKEVDKINKLTLKKNQLKIMTLNVNNFKSINLDDNPSFILDTLLSLVENMNVDMCFLQEFNIDLQIKSKKYNYIFNKELNGLVVLYKNSLNIKNINFFKLINERHFDQTRFCLHFNLNNKKFATTHLNIGKGIYNRKGEILNPEDLYKMVNYNYEYRKNQLNQILDKVPNPDFLIGEFNFLSFVKEFDYLTKIKKYNCKLFNDTTPFGEQTNFIFSKNPYKFFTKIKFPYSYYFPSIAIIDT